jgi:hypothetical protein
MNKKITSILRQSDGRYLNEAERQELLKFARGMEARLKAAAEVETAEKDAVTFCIEEMKKRYPNFQRFHQNAWAKAFRDVQLTVRHNVQAMVADSPEMLEEKLLHWLKTILASFSFTPRFNRDTYMLLKQGIKERVSSQAFALIEPYLDRNIEILSDFPEPATAAV